MAQSLPELKDETFGQALGLLETYADNLYGEAEAASDSISKWAESIKSNSALTQSQLEMQDRLEQIAQVLATAGEMFADAADKLGLDLSEYAATKSAKFRKMIDDPEISLEPTIFYVDAEVLPEGDRESFDATEGGLYEINGSIDSISGLNGPIDPMNVIRDVSAGFASLVTTEDSPWTSRLKSRLGNAYSQGILHDGLIEITANQNYASKAAPGEIRIYMHSSALTDEEKQEFEITDDGYHAIIGGTGMNNITELDKVPQLRSSVVRDIKNDIAEAVIAENSSEYGKLQEALGKNFGADKFPNGLVAVYWKAS